MTTPKVEGAKPRRRGLKILGIVGVVLAVIVVALLVYSNVPNKASDLPESVSAESRERNTLIATSLVVGGIEDSFVDVTPERVFVSYELPASDAPSNESDVLLQQFVLGAAAQGAPSSAQAVIVQNVNGTMVLQWEVETAKVLDFLEGKTTEEELMAAIKVTRA